MSFVGFYSTKSRTRSAIYNVAVAAVVVTQIVITGKAR